MFSEGWVMTCLGALEGIDLTAGIEAGERVVVRAVIKGEPGAEG